MGRIAPLAAGAAALLVAVSVATACQPRLAGAPGCPVLPDDSVWHADVSKLPVDPRSSAYVAAIGASASLKADFGSGLWDGGPIGIPYATVDSATPRVAVSFDYADESDPGPYPIPPDVPIEGGADSDGDRHVIVVDKDACILYELYAAYPQGDGTWRAGSGAIYDLRSNALRPDGWTSADAAGLPILPGLVRYEEIAAGVIGHAIRVTVPRTQRAAVWPARHVASSRTDPALPPMGLRLRLKANVDISGYPPELRVILTALKTYGMIVADNGSPWFMSGAPDEQWDNDMLHLLGALHGSDFEAVDVTSLMVDPNSGATAAR